MTEREKTILDIAENLQKERHEFIKQVMAQRPNATQEDAAAIWLDIVLAKIILETNINIIPTSLFQP